MPVPRLYVSANLQRKPELKGVLDELLPWLKRETTLVGVDRNGSASLSGIHADLILVFAGGDGSILSVARRLDGNATPVLGVNTGQLGFLAEAYRKDLKEVLPRVLGGDRVINPRMMLKVSFNAGGKKRVQEFLALNDAVLLRQPMDSMMTLDVRVSDEQISNYKGDGLIVATATGSTGYNLSAGGPILSERLKAMIVTPICPHTLANRTIVLDGGEKLAICPSTRAEQRVATDLDGQLNFLPRRAEPKSIFAGAEKEFNLWSPSAPKAATKSFGNKLHWAELGQEEVRRASYNIDDGSTSMIPKRPAALAQHFGHRAAQNFRQTVRIFSFDQQVVTVEVLDSRDWRRCRPEDFNENIWQLFACEIQGATQGRSRILHGFFVGAFENDASEFAPGRILELFALAQFIEFEDFSVERRGGLDGAVVGTAGLNDDFAASVAAAGAPGNLGEQLPGALASAEVGHVESGVG